MKPCLFYFRGKIENSTKKKNEQGDVCFLINYKFLCKIPFKVKSFFGSVVTMCDIFYSRFKRFLALMFFTKYILAWKTCLFFAFFCFLLLAYSQKKYGISQVHFFKYEKLIFWKTHIFIFLKFKMHGKVLIFRQNRWVLSYFLTYQNMVTFWTHADKSRSTLRTKCDILCRTLIKLIKNISCLNFPLTPKTLTTTSVICHLLKASKHL